MSEKRQRFFCKVIERVCQLKRNKDEIESEYDNPNYQKTRKEVTELDIMRQNLQGSLKLAGFSSLQKLNCSYNQLTELDLTDCQQLIRIYCQNNRLTNLILPENNQIRELRCLNNNFQSDLTIFSNLVNLVEELGISGNQFMGSLSPLANLVKLKKLVILNTQIDDGLEYLPESLESFYCDETKLVEELEVYGKPNYPDYHLPFLQSWKKDYSEWLRRDFTKEEIGRWTKAGLAINELNFAVYLKEKDYEPTADLKNNKAQLWLDFYYPEGLKKEIFKELLFSFNKIKDNKFVLNEKLVFAFPFKEIPSKYWNKVEVDNNWDWEYVEAESIKKNGWSGGGKIPMMFSYGIDFNNSGCDGPWDRRFKNQEILDNFRKYAEESFLKIPTHNHYNNTPIENLKIDEIIRIHEPSKLTKSLKNANKLFFRNGCSRVVNKEAFEFLQSIIESRKIIATIKLEKGDEIDLRDWTVTELDISNKNLTGDLDLKNFPNLRVLNCENNQLTNLNLQSCQKLKELNIKNTQINNNLEHLPGDLETIYCAGSLAEELKDYHKQGSEYNYKAWKKDCLTKAKIPTFEREIKRLTDLIKQQKEKIINAYTHFFQEKELLRELIEAHLAYRKVIKQKLPTSAGLKKQYDKIYYELEEKVGEAKMGEVLLILDDCEELIHYEAELEAEITKRRLSIEETKQVIKYITYLNAPINVNQGHLLIGNDFKNNTNLSYNNAQVGNVNIEHSQFTGEVAIGVGKIGDNIDFRTINQNLTVANEEFAEEFQAHTIQQPNSVKKYICCKIV